MVIFFFSVFRQKYPLWENFVQNAVFNGNVPFFSAFDRKYSFGQIWSKIKIWCLDLLEYAEFIGDTYFSCFQIKIYHFWENLA